MDGCFFEGPHWLKAPPTPTDNEFQSHSDGEIARLRKWILDLESELEKWVRFKTTPRSNVQDYVVGFAFDEKQQRVCLIRKNRPDWQKGFLNGPGGHVEPGETIWQAMTREFHEECGVYARGWQLFCNLSFPKAEVYFMRHVFPDVEFNRITTKTDELVNIVTVGALPCAGVLPNLYWLIPLAIKSPELITFGKDTLA